MASGLHTLQYSNAAVTASIPYGYEIGYAGALFLARPVSFPSPEVSCTYMRSDWMRSTLGFALAAFFSLAAQAAPEKMQAAEVGVGGTLSVQWRPVPQPGAGEVLIKVRAAGVNPVDWKAAQRRLGMVPGTDVSGTIDSVGEGVTDWKVGEAVLDFARQSGSYAEYAVIPVKSLARKPKSMSFEQAAGVPIAAETAYRALHETGKIARGQTVLIHAGSGGVGTLAIQLAKHVGATVATTTSTANVDLVRSLGADVVIDYKKEDFADVLRDYDVVLNSLDKVTLEKSLRVLKPGGQLISISGPPDAAFARTIGASWVLRMVMGALSRGIRAQAKRRQVQYSFLFMRANGGQLAKITSLIDDGIIRPVVDRVFPFASTKEAMAYVEAGRAKGKVVVSVRES